MPVVKPLLDQLLRAWETPELFISTRCFAQARSAMAGLFLSVCWSSRSPTADPFQQTAQLQARIHFRRVRVLQIQTACECRAMSGNEFGDVAPIHADPQLEMMARARFGPVDLKAVVVAHFPI